MSEADVMRGFQILASKLGARLFRQQTGMGWTGTKVERIAATRSVLVHAGDVIIRGARPFHSGFSGWSDLGGFVPVEITPDMVGEKIAIYAQVEVKVGTSATAEQKDWISAVKAAGGRAGIARCEADLIMILGISQP